MCRTIKLLAITIAMIWSPVTMAQDKPNLSINELARDVELVESLRAAKDLQRFYSQYAQFGMWEEMADLFTEDAKLVWDEKEVSGKSAIADWLKARVGGKRGLAPGALHSELVEDPLINLSADGRSAKSRWMALAMAGDGQGGSWIEGGIYENEYALDGGVWKISKLHFYTQYEGDYEIGWTNANNAELPHVPFHFTIDETGIPIPPVEGAAPATDVTLGELERRIADLNAEDAVRNLQNAYGYYVDRRMWDDVVDLFTADGVIEIAGTGIFTGSDGVREALETTMGPQGLSRGVQNEYPSFDTLVTVMPGGQEAFARGIAFGMLGRGKDAGWEFQLFRNRFVKEGGIWKVREMRLYPLVKASYTDGWANGGTWHLPHGSLPAFTEPHPVTGKETLIEGFTLLGAEPLTGEIAPADIDTASYGETQRLLNARRRLRRSWAYDGVVNVSSAYGYYLDDFQWVALSSIFAQKGNKHSPFAGFYLGQDRIKAAATAMWGEPPEFRRGISFHWRFQPVIHVSHDGRSANLRTRLFQPRTSLPRPASGGRGFVMTAGFNSGMYPNDQAVLEDGIWRLWSLTIDEHYMTSKDWKTGWAGVEPTPPGEGGGQSPLVERLAPDILMTELGRRAEHFRGGTGITYTWPDILPMWFHYKNPVSGRVPELYWPDSVPALDLPEARLVSNGYQMPPNGPEQDGIHIELTPPETNVMGE